jgi:hypothetical protein
LGIVVLMSLLSVPLNCSRTQLTQQLLGGDGVTSQCGRDDVIDALQIYIRDPRAITRIMKVVDIYVLGKTRQAPELPPVEDSWCRACGKDLPPGQDCCRSLRCQSKLLKDAGYISKPGFVKPAFIRQPNMDPPKQCALDGCGEYVFWPQKNFCTKTHKREHDKEMASIWKAQREERKV